MSTDVPSAETDGYLDHFGLTRPPFGPVAESDFLYPGRSYSAIRDELTHALRHQEGLILLLGDSGTGKTTLYRSLLQTPGPDLFLSVIADPFLTVEDLLRQVLNDFGVRSEEAQHGASLAHTTCHDLVLAVQRFVESLSVSHARAVLVIDDAHQLDPAVLMQLRALSNLETAAVKLQMILVGQPPLEALLRQPGLQQLRQRVARRCVLPPLTSAEIRLYLDHRLAAAKERADAAGDGTPPETIPPSRALLTFQAVAALGRLAGGIPRTVDLLCERALEVGHERRASRIDGPIVLDAARRLDLPISATARLWCVRPVTVAMSSALVTAVLLASLWASGRVHVPSPFARRAQAPIASPLPALPIATTHTMPSATDANASTPSDEPIATSALQTAESYVVVVASFRTAQHADEVLSRFIALGLPAFIRDADGGRWHLVLIGPYASSDEANDVREQIGRAEFVDSRVTRQPAAELSRP